MGVVGERNRGNGERGGKQEEEEEEGGTGETKSGDWGGVWWRGGRGGREIEEKRDGRQ